MMRARAVVYVNEKPTQRDSGIAQHACADSASVIFDTIQTARARDIDVLIADTAGRLRTQTNLIDELKNVKRVIARLGTGAIPP